MERTRRLWEPHRRHQRHLFFSRSVGQPLGGEISQHTSFVILTYNIDAVVTRGPRNREQVRSKGSTNARASRWLPIPIHFRNGTPSASSTYRWAYNEWHTIGFYWSEVYIKNLRRFSLSKQICLIGNPLPRQYNWMIPLPWHDPLKCMPIVCID